VEVSALPLSSEKPETPIEPWLRKPWFAAVTTVIGVMAGALGSIYSTELKSSIQFISDIVAPGKIFLFWGLLFVFGLFFGGVQWAHLRANARSHKELSTLVEDLMSIPPTGFLQAFADSYQLSEEAACETINDPNPTKEQTARTLRTVLTLIATLALLYHQDSHGKNKPRYAANIMLFKELEELSHEEKEAVKGRLWLFEEEDFNTCFGALDLVKEFSTSTDSQNPEKDGSLKKGFAFLVPHIDEPLTDDKLRQSQVLPGAPWAFITQKVHSFVNPEQLIKFVAQMDFRPTTRDDFIQELNDYFNSVEGQMVKSFISFPIPQPDFGKNARPLGILNIHRDTTDMLKDKGIRSFPHLMHPFLGTLARLINHHESLPPTQSEHPQESDENIIPTSG